MAERYDVIIIGTGAGGGTLAHTLAPSGKRILLLERGDFLPRESENWEPDPVFIEGRYISKDTWYDADGKAFQPQVHYFVGGATKMYGAALYRLRPAGLRRAEARRRRLSRVATFLRRLRALVHQGRVALSGPREPRRGPDGGHVEQAVPVPRGVPRAEDPAALGRPDGGRVPPVPRAVRDHAERGASRDEHLHPMHVVRRLSVPRPCEVGRRVDRGASDPGRTQRDAARERRGHAARDRCVGRCGHERGRVS